MKKKRKKHSVQRAQAHVQAKEEKKKCVLIENTGTENIKIANKIHTSAYNGRMAPKINELRIRESQTSKGNNIFGANDENTPDWMLDTYVRRIQRKRRKEKRAREIERDTHNNECAYETSIWRDDAGIHCVA